MRNLGRTIVATASACAITLSLAAGAVASDDIVVASSLSANDITFIEGQFDKLGVELDVRDTLIATIASGGVVESEQSGAVPVTTVTTVENGYEYVTETYSDGSVARSGVQLPAVTDPSVITPRGVVDCVNGAYSANATTYRLGCKVEYDAPSWHAHFRAGVIKWGYEGALITNISQQASSGIGVTYPALSLIRSNGGQNGTAHAKLTFQQTIGFLSATVGFNLKVSNANGIKLTTDV